MHDHRAPSRSAEITGRRGSADLSGRWGGRPDLWIGALIALLGCALAMSFMRDVGLLFYYQTLMPEAVLWACEQGFRFPIERPAALNDFLFLRARELDCAALQGIATAEAGPSAYGHYYLVWSTALLWRLGGVSYQSLWPLAVLLYSTYAVGCFVLLRLCFARLPATIGAVLLTVSPLALSMLFLLRDFSKAPFIIWAVALIIIAHRARSDRGFVVAAAASAAMIGLGAGFRPDVMIVTPLLFLLLVVSALAGRGKRGVAGGTVAVVAVLWLLTLPASMNGIRGGFGMLLLQGATEPFTRHMRLDPAAFNFGKQYSDELALSTIAADLPRVPQPAPGATDAGATAPATAMTRSTSYIVERFPYFIGDLATRAIKSAYLVIGSPYLTGERFRQSDPHPALPPELLPKVTKLLLPVYQTIAVPVLPVAALIGLLAFLYRRFIDHRSEALLWGGTILLLSSYPAAQFSFRHLFHLEFIFFLAILGLAAIRVEHLDWRQFRTFLACTAAVVVGIGGAWWGALRIQSTYVEAEVRSLLTAPRTPVAFAPQAQQDGRHLVRVPMSEKHVPIVERGKDSLTVPTVEDGVPSSVIAGYDRFVIALDLARCERRRIRLGVHYRTVAGVWQRFDHEVTVRRRKSESGKFTVIVPGFYRWSQQFDGITFDREALACVEGLARIDGQSDLPAAFEAVLGDRWTTRLTQRF